VAAFSGKRADFDKFPGNFCQYRIPFGMVALTVNDHDLFKIFKAAVFKKILQNCPGFILGKAMEINDCIGSFAEKTAAAAGSETAFFLLSIFVADSVPHEPCIKGLVSFGGRNHGIGAGTSLLSGSFGSLPVPFIQYISEIHSQPQDFPIEFVQTPEQGYFKLVNFE
jgi:hypothetical protein